IYEYFSRYSNGSVLLQIYTEWQHKFTDNVVMNVGLHGQDFLLNQYSYAIEPRLGFKWNFTEKQSIGIAGGIHSQLQPMSVYFFSTQLPNGSYANTNQNLGFSKSNH